MTHLSLNILPASCPGMGGGGNQQHKQPAGFIVSSKMGMVPEAGMLGMAKLRMPLKEVQHKKEPGSGQRSGS